MTNKLTSVWFAYAGMRERPEDVPLDIRDLLLTPYDSYESALCALREDARHVWDRLSINRAPDFSVMDEITIRDTLANIMEDHDDVLVEIKEVAIINHTATGWRSLELKAAQDALRIPSPPESYRPSTYVPAHRFQSGLSANNHVTRCVVNHNGKDYFGPWRGDEASALTAALLLIQNKE